MFTKNHRLRFVSISSQWHCCLSRILKKNKQFFQSWPSHPATPTPRGFSFSKSTANRHCAWRRADRMWQIYRHTTINNYDRCFMFCLQFVLSSAIHAGSKTSSWEQRKRGFHSDSNDRTSLVYTLSATLSHSCGYPSVVWSWTKRRLRLASAFSASQKKKTCESSSPSSMCALLKRLLKRVLKADTTKGCRKMG